MRDQPEIPVDRAFRKYRCQRVIRVADKAWQHANACADCDQSVLRDDARRTDIGGQAGYEIVQIVEFGRINQIRNIADQMILVPQFL